MIAKIQNQLVSILIVVLLLLQSGLSVVIISKLNTLIVGLEKMEAAQAVGAVNNEIRHVDNVSVDDDPAKGPGQALITIVEFADFECPYCASSVQMIKAILSDYRDEVRFVYRDFPVEYSHPHALRAAEAANCAGEQQKFWEMHDLLFLNQASLDDASLLKYAMQLQLDEKQFEDCLTNGKYVDEIRHDIDDGRAYGVLGTPTFFVNGYMVTGEAPMVLRQIIKDILEGKIE